MSFEWTSSALNFFEATLKVVSQKNYFGFKPWTAMRLALQANIVHRVVK